MSDIEREPVGYMYRHEEHNEWSVEIGQLPFVVNEHKGWQIEPLYNYPSTKALEALILRKQSEAVDAVIKRIREARHKVDRASVEESDTACTLRIAESIAIGESQRLRQQAAESENV